MATLTTQGNFIQGIAWSPDSKRIAAGNNNNLVTVWNASTGKQLLLYSGHSDSVERIAWSPDGKEIASASHDGTVQVWDASTGKQIISYKDHNNPVWTVAWSPDGKKIASGTGSAGESGPTRSGNSARVWDPTTGKTLLTYEGQGSNNEVYALAWSPDGTRIASAGDEYSIRIWDPSTGQTYLLYSGHTDIIWQVAWSPDGKEIASASQDGTVRVWPYSQ